MGCDCASRKSRRPSLSSMSPSLAPSMYYSPSLAPSMYYSPSPSMSFSSPPMMTSLDRYHYDAPGLKSSHSKSKSRHMSLAMSLGSPTGPSSSFVPLSR